jgi:hypothetical protein
MTQARHTIGGAAGWRVLQIFCMALAAVPALLCASLAREGLRSGGATGWWRVAGAALTVVVVAAVAHVARVAGAMSARARALAARRALHPGEPWLWPKEWEGGRIRASGGLERRLFVAAALLWNALLLTLGVLAHRWGVLGEANARLVLLVAALCGLLLALMAALLVREARYGPSLFEMASVPGVLGGPLRGVVQLPPGLPQGTELTVALRCVRTVVWEQESWKSSSWMWGGQRSRSRSWGAQTSTPWCLWQDEVTGPAPTGALPVSFTTAYDLPESTLPWATGSTVRWTLNVQALQVGYQASFEVPVFRTEASDPNAQGGTRSVAQPARSKVRLLESGPHGVSFALPSFNLAPGIASAVVVPALAWAAVRYFAAPPVVVTVGLWYALVTGTLMPIAVLITARRVDVDGTSLRVRHGLGPLTWTRAIPLETLVEIKHDASGDPKHGRVAAHVKGGKKYWVAAHLDGLEDAKWLAAELTRAVTRRG